MEGTLHGMPAESQPADAFTFACSIVHQVQGKLRRGIGPGATRLRGSLRLRSRWLISLPFLVPDFPMVRSGAVVQSIHRWRLPPFPPPLPLGHERRGKVLGVSFL